MWDPQAYRDSDFGLDRDETFEPGDVDFPGEVDRTLPYVQTVLGPIEPDQVGICQVREHVLSENTASQARLDRLDYASAELETYFTVGGRTVVDVTTREGGRNAAGLKALAQRVPVNLIAAAGWLNPPASGNGDSLDVETLASDVLAEIESGIGTTGVRPGVVVAGNTPALISAAALVAKRSGNPLYALQALGDPPSPVLDSIEKQGLSPGRVILGGIEPGFEWQNVQVAARRGAWVAFDGIGRGGAEGDRDLAKAIVRLAEAGYSDRILVSQGLGRTTDFQSYGGGPGWSYLLERFTLELMDAGAPAGLVRTLLVDNPSAALSIQPG